MKVGQAIAEIMKREGIEILCGYPVNHLIEFAAAIDIRPIMVRQERIGLHMADAMSRLSSGRKLGAFCMQHGPGAENAYGGVAQCFGESVPVLVLPMGYQRRLAQLEPNFSSTQAMRSVTKSAEAVWLPAEVPNVMRRAFTRLRNGRGGPCLVEIPADIFNEEVPEPLAYTPVVSTRYGPDPSDVDRAAAALAEPKREAVEAFVAAEATARKSGGRAGEAEREAVRTLSERLSGLASANRRMLERALAAQDALVRVLSEAAQPVDGRYVASGAPRPVRHAAPAVTLAAQL